MKNLNEIKNEVAKEHGTEWNELMSDCGGNSSDIQDYTDEVAKRYAEEAIKECAERAETTPCIAQQWWDIEVDKDSILNIIKELK